VQDLSFLDDLLDAESKSRRGQKFAGLSKAICELVEDFGLVGFETLCVEARPLLWRDLADNEQDKISMATLVKKIDKALGYVPPPTDEDEADENLDYSQFFRPLDVSMATQLDPQERWIDSKAEYDEYEKEGWEKEGQLVQERGRADGGG
jgi:hypothetical protein